MDLIEKLRAYKDAKGLTQFDLCKELDCQGATLSGWLLGKRKPGRAWREVIESFLKTKGVLLILLCIMLSGCGHLYSNTYSPSMREYRLKNLEQAYKSGQIVLNYTKAELK